MLKVIVNGATFEIRAEDNSTLLNDEIFEWNVSPIQDRMYHIIHDHKSYTAELVSANIVEKKFKLKINGNIYEVDVKDKMDLLLDKLGMSQMASSALSEIKAPMPGLILQIHVEEGMEVKKGDPIMVLEAMKMENIIKSPGEGTIKSIVVKKGQSVEKNQVLIKFF